MSESNTREITDLIEAFKHCSKETTKLETSYEQIQTHLETINQGLQEKVTQLNIATNYLNDLLNNISQGILFVGISGLVLTYNAFAEKTLGIPAHEILYRPFWDVLKDDVFGFSMKEALANTWAPSTYCHYSRNEHRFDLEVSTTLTSLVGKSHQGLILLIRDITEMRRLQRIANHHDRMQEIGQLAAAVAHEVRNPLGGIKGFASILEHDLANEPHLKKMAHYIVDGASAVDRLVTNALNYGRVQELKWEMVELSAHLRETVELVKADTAFSRITFDLRLPTHPLTCPLDSSLFRSALLNLLANARDAMPKGGALTLGLKQCPKEAEITIGDEGMGIPLDIQEKVFSPFFTTKPEGNGFGLAQVYKTIKAHGGSIDLFSEPAKGTTFTIKVPIKEQHEY